MDFNYLVLGIKHILDLSAYDHLLFVLALSVCRFDQSLKSTIILLSIFTISHSITLVLNVLNLIPFNLSWVETAIPITILFTALLNFIEMKFFDSRILKLHFLLVFIFGLIHGLGFSGYLRSILSEEDHLLGFILSFNLGIEIGQIFIFFMFFLFTYLLNKQLNISSNQLKLVINSLILIFTAQLMF